MDFVSVCARKEKSEKRDCVGILEEQHCTCCVVADGKSGSNASEIVVQSILDSFKQCSDITTDTLPGFFDTAQSALIRASQSDGLLQSCAAAVMLTNGELAVWGHIGDCRIYHLRGGLLYEITPDHSEAYTAYEAGEQRYPMIRSDRKRNRLFRLMGNDNTFKPDFSAPAVIRKNDSFLICTDGFWTNIHEKQIERTLRHTRSAKTWLDKMIKITKKNGRDGKYTKVSDDSSAIAIRI